MDTIQNVLSEIGEIFKDGDAKTKRKKIKEWFNADKVRNLAVRLNEDRVNLQFFAQSEPL